MAPLAPREDALRSEQSEAPLVAIRGTIGCVVHGRNGLKGRLRDIFFDIRSARILYAVVGVGGMLGYGEQLAALPWSLLRFDPRLNVFTAPLDSAEMRRSKSIRLEELKALGLVPLRRRHL